MAGDKPDPAFRISWQRATLLIAVLSMAGWFCVWLITRWLLG